MQKTTRTFFISMLTCYCLAGHGQNPFTPSGKSVSGGIYSTQVPIYKTKQDSILLAKCDLEMKKIVAQKPFSKKRLDSIVIQRDKMYERGIEGFRTIYYPTPGYLPFDSLSYIKDKSAIRRLSISSKKIKSLPKEILACTNLEVLEIVNTSFTKLQDDLDQLKYLKKITILNNRSSRHLKLQKNSIVTTLIIRGEHPHSLPRSFRKMTALTKLDLAGTGLTKYHNGARHNRHLEELEMQGNTITLKENNIKLHPYLKRLGLQYNKIESVPSSISNLPNLLKLAFNYNQIANVHPNIGKLKILEHISFYNNKLTSVPSGLYDLHKLKSVDLFYNRIYQVDDRITNWPDLYTLYLSHNYLTALPESVAKLPSLVEIYAHDNLLKSLPSSICGITQLRVLRVNENKLNEMPSCIDRLVNLEEFDVSNNNLTQLPEAIFNFEKMKIIVLTNNSWNNQLQTAFPELLQKMYDRGVAIHLESKESSRLANASKQ